MTFQDYFNIIWRKKWIVLITVAATLLVVAVGSWLTKPTYASTATLRIATAASGSVSYTDYVYNDRLVNTYVQIATSRPVLDELVNRLGLAEVPVVRVEIVTNTELIDITVEASDPGTAELAANTLANIMIEQSKSLYTGSGKDQKEILAEQLTQIEQELTQARADYDALVRKSPSDSEAIAAANQSIELKQNTYATLLEQYEEARLRDALRANTISMVEPAMREEKPIRPNLLVNFGLATILSGLAGLSMVFIFNHFDRTLHTSGDIEKAIGQHALVKIPATHPKHALLPEEKNSHYGESYRRLRAAFLYQMQSLNLKVIMITSPQPAEGKSTICANLAWMMAQSGKQVVLVDCDTNISRMQSVFQLSNEVGLVDVLMGQATVEDALQQTGSPGLKVMTSGIVEPGVEIFSQNTRLRGVISELAGMADIVLLDSPAIMAVADVTDLVTEVDAIAMVVRRGSTNRDALDDACKQLDKLNVRNIGFIINHAEQDGLAHNYAYYHASGGKARPLADKIKTAFKKEE